MKNGSVCVRAVQDTRYSTDICSIVQQRTIVSDKNKQRECVRIAISSNRETEENE